ncbi:hypothetical protein HJ01_01000 [Flavobacterium frigoris PS1]|uniref:Uncharacterized protein n=2 Tax=Flavobacterium frigoris TaxID=229204 RepID=H7FPA2_FLAFP|nr:hypothetical protein HJ01_01000 [Flavobacterium frigoris PS1]
MLAVMWAVLIGLGLGTTKGIEWLSIEVGLIKAVWAFVYFGVISAVYFISNSWIKDELIVKPNVNFKGQLIKGKNLDIHVKRSRIHYNILVVICLAVFIYGFSLAYHFDFIFIFFLLVPVTLYGINHGIGQAASMTYAEKEEYIYAKKKSVDNTHDS